MELSEICVALMLISISPAVILLLVFLIPATIKDIIKTWSQKDNMDKFICLVVISTIFAAFLMISALLFQRWGY